MMGSFMMNRKFFSDREELNDFLRELTDAEIPWVAIGDFHHDIQMGTNVHYVKEKV